MKDERLDPWRVAKLRIVTGVPGLLICLLAPVLIYKKVGLPLEGAPFWLFYGVVLSIFAGYFAWVVYVAWRDKRAMDNPPPPDAEDDFYEEPQSGESPEEIDDGSE